MRLLRAHRQPADYRRISRQFVDTHTVEPRGSHTPHETGVVSKLYLNNNSKTSGEAAKFAKASHTYESDEAGLATELVVRSTPSEAHGRRVREAASVQSMCVEPSRWRECTLGRNASLSLCAVRAHSPYSLVVAGTQALCCRYSSNRSVASRERERAVPMV